MASKPGRKSKDGQQLAKKAFMIFAREERNSVGRLQLSFYVYPVFDLVKPVESARTTRKYA